MMKQIPRPISGGLILSYTNKVISMKTLIIKSLLTSLYQREGIYPSLAKRGEGRFFNNDSLLMNSFVNAPLDMPTYRACRFK